MFSCVGTHLCMCRCMWYVPGDHIDVGVFLFFSPFKWLKQSVAEPGTHLVHLDTSSLEYPCFCFQWLGFQAAATSTFLYVVAGYSNSELHIYVASVLSTDPCPTHQSIREHSLDFFLLFPYPFLFLFFLNWQFSCFCLLCAGITGVCSHAWLASVIYIS